MAFEENVGKNRNHFKQKARQKEESDDKKLEHNDKKKELFSSVCLQMHLFSKK